jgi:hypothetical protein
MKENKLHKISFRMGLFATRLLVRIKPKLPISIIEDDDFKLLFNLQKIGFNKREDEV